MGIAAAVMSQVAKIFRSCKRFWWLGSNYISVFFFRYTELSFHTRTISPDSYRLYIYTVYLVWVWEVDKYKSDPLHAPRGGKNKFQKLDRLPFEGKKVDMG